MVGFLGLGGGSGDRKPVGQAVPAAGNHPPRERRTLRPFVLRSIPFSSIFREGKRGWGLSGMQEGRKRFGIVDVQAQVGLDLGRGRFSWQNFSRLQQAEALQRELGAGLLLAATE